MFGYEQLLVEPQPNSSETNSLVSDGSPTSGCMQKITLVS